MNKTPEKDYPKSPFSFNTIVNQRKTIFKNMHNLLYKKYSTSPKDYNVIIIDNIIYNEKSHIVATFKDHLIIDDTGEFLKRFYSKEESDIRLKKFYEYYDLYSKMFPNYTAFNEGKYLYQNIQKKQRMIDLQEKMELDRKKNEEKSDSFSSFTESKEDVFDTDVINSILNGTNNESLNNLFDINKGDLEREEEVFGKEVNNLIEEINKYESNKKKVELNYKIIKLDKNKNDKNKNQINYNKVIKYNNQLEHNNNNNLIHNNANNIKIETFKDTITIRNIAVPINLNYTKNKRLFNSNSSSIIINNNNITYYNDIRNIVNKYFNYPSYQKNIFLNMNNKSNKNNKMHKFEQNLFKMKQKTLLFQKNSSQNMSTTNQTQKDISLTKKNSNNIYSKIPISSTLIKQNPKNIRKNVNNFSSCKNKSNNSIQNMQSIEKKNKGITPLTSRNPKNDKIAINIEKSKSTKNIKGNMYSISNAISRNRYSNNMKVHNKMKSSISGMGYSQLSKMNQSQNKTYNQKKLLNITKIKSTDAKPKIGYKEITFLRNQNSRNRNEIKQKILNSGTNMNSSRNYNVKSLNKNNSQKAVVNNRKKNLNDSALKLGIMDIMNVKKNLAQGFNIKNFSKVFNASNNNNYNNPKYNFTKTYRENYVIINK